MTSPNISAVWNEWVLMYITLGATPVPVSFNDELAFSAPGLTMNVCMNFVNESMSASGSVAVGPSASTPIGISTLSANVSPPNVRVSRLIGSFACALSTRVCFDLSAGSRSSCHSRLSQPKNLFHRCPNTTVSTASVTSRPRYRSRG